MNPKYRIIQRGNDLFYAQERCWLFFWRDIPCTASVYQSVPMQAIEKRQDQDDRVQRFRTIKKVIAV